MSFAEQVVNFISSLTFPLKLQEGIEVMNPFKDEVTLSICKKFYHKFYGDSNERRMIIGINPGRFGGGVTGIPFTDPIRLEQDCEIPNGWSKKQELSSVFIYEMINCFGGPVKFYESFYITAISPLGFTRNNKNLNYYDDALLQKEIKPFVIDALNLQLKFGVKRDKAFCLGEGKNLSYLTKLNNEFHFFDDIVPLSHPRFIMQYRLKKKKEYIDDYITKLCSSLLIPEERIIENLHT
jgi:hypothetical protein